MRNNWHLTSWMLSVIIVSSHADANCANSPFIVTVECANGPDCKYQGRDIPIIIRISNISQVDVYLTADYMQKTGPYSTFKDVRTGREWYGHTKLGIDELLSRYTRIRPGQSVGIRYKLYSEEISIFSKVAKEVNVVVEFEFFAKWKSGSDERFNFDEKASVNISASDTLGHQ